MSNLELRTDMKGNMTVKVYGPANVYPTACLCEGVQVGAFSEVGHNVIVGDRTKIGMGSFLCEGVKIGKDVFIGPRVVFTNDPFPPSTKENWLDTIIEDNVAIGANATIKCGITIGTGALIGCGSVVTKDIPAGETWCGNPAKKMDKPQS